MNCILSPQGCVHSGEECSSDNKCCSSRDTCVTKYHDNKHMSATCQDLSDVLSPSERKGEGETRVTIKTFNFNISDVPLTLAIFEIL